MSEVGFVLLIQSLQSACVVPLGSCECEFGPKLVLKNGMQRVCRKFL